MLSHALSRANREENQIMTAHLHTATLGYIGLGDQGTPMAQAIGDSGFELHVRARRPQNLDVLARTRYSVHDSPASLAAAAGIVELCLRDDCVIWEVLGTPGVEDALRRGLIIVNHGTGNPGENREIAGHLAGKSVAYLDSPVNGGGARARTRTLTTTAGSDRTAYQMCEPVFTAFSRTVAFMGPSGSGPGHEAPQQRHDHVQPRQRGRPHPPGVPAGHGRAGGHRRHRRQQRRQHPSCIPSAPT